MSGFGSVTVGTPNALTNDYTIKVINDDTTTPDAVHYIATVIVPAASVETEASELKVTVEETAPQTEGALGIQIDGEIQSFEITVEGLKEDNDQLVEVRLYVGPNRNVSDTVYHTLDNGTVEEIQGNYNQTTGYITFETTSFSPFSVVILDGALPVDPEQPDATITKLEGEQNYEWGLAGTELDGIIRLVDPDELDVYYSFKAQQDVETAKKNKYADWKCDYFVKVEGIDQLEAGDIILGGNYGGMQIAFTNMVPVDGDTWIPLLMTMGQGWTYAEIVEGVGEFICGVKDGGDLAAQNVIFRVQLRLVDPTVDNPADPAEGEYVVVNEVVYDFATGESFVREVE